MGFILIHRLNSNYYPKLRLVRLNFQGIIRKDSPNGFSTDNVTTLFKNNFEL